MKEAVARIKLNRLLEAAGWRFFAEGGAPANIQLEHGVRMNATRAIEALRDPADPMLDWESAERDRLAVAYTGDGEPIAEHAVKWSLVKTGTIYSC